MQLYTNLISSNKILCRIITNSDIAGLLQFTEHPKPGQRTKANDSFYEVFLLYDPGVWLFPPRKHHTKSHWAWSSGGYCT